MNRITLKTSSALAAVALLLAGCVASEGDPEQEPTTDHGKQWLAGDHHTHTVFSAEWDKRVDPPEPILGGDAHYSIELNARMGQQYGLSWIVTTDHGGPNHSNLNREQAYPELLTSRQATPGVMQFYGMELDTPGAKHSTIIVPHTADEAERLYQFEKAFAWKDAYPEDASRNTEERMLDALKAMREWPQQPLMIVNHPARAATDLGAYTNVTPHKLRSWNDTAPTIAVGMEGAPGHQASSLNPDDSPNKDRSRGDYDNYPTMGGFDQMTARLGGFWDSMLGEGRRWWITSNSDSHIHYTDGDKDFWPGEYSKTYVYAEKSYPDILAGLRDGHIFVTTGDLISELYVTARSDEDGSVASIGDRLEVASGSTVHITMRFLDPDTPNAHGDNPAVSRVDLIKGHMTGVLEDPSIDTNPTTAVAERFAAAAWERDGVFSVATYKMENVTESAYIRVRGTNGAELEPAPDPLGEDPWTDLWFYSNPIFISVN